MSIVEIDAMDELDAPLARYTMLVTFGPDRYKKFVADLNGRCQSNGRMFFWQEEMWKQVQAQLGVRITDFKTVTGLFRVCHVHNEDLQQELVPVVHGTRQSTGSYIEAMEAMFPSSNEVLLGPCWQELPSHRQVFFCKACRVANKRWQELGAN